MEFVMAVYEEDYSSKFVLFLPLVGT